MKQCTIRLERRRWVSREDRKRCYYNQYTYTEEGCKVSRKFASFFKILTGKDPFDLKVVSDVLQVQGGTPRHWIRDSILKIDSKEVQEGLHGMDFETPKAHGTGSDRRT